MNDVKGAGAAPLGTTAGRLLREARQAQGLHIAALASAIKVAPRKLELLEADRFDELPDATFTRALAQTVCRALKLDPVPVLALLPRPDGNRLVEVGEGLNAPFRERSAGLAPDDWSALARPAVWGPALLLVAAAAVYFLPAGLFESMPWNRAGPAASAPVATAPPEPAAPASTGAPAVVAAAPVGVAASAGLDPAAPPAPPGSTSAAGDTAAAPAAVVPGPAASAGAPAVPNAAAPSLVAAGPAATTPLSGAATPAAMSPGAAASGAASMPADIEAHQLVLRAARDSWIEVVDARGKALLSRLVKGGESVGLDGTAPLRLRIGNAPATEVVYRGQAVDLAPRTSGNIARFELP